MTTIVRFDCGCIGTEPIDGYSSILQACDSDDNGPGSSDRHMGTKSFERTDFRVQVWADATDAHAYRELRNNLRRVLAE